VSWKILEAEDLRKVEMFKILTDEELGEIIPLMSTIEVAPGTLIFKEGDPGDALFVILNGEVRISKDIHGVGEEALAFLHAGSYFGEMALVGEVHPRSASALAEDRCQLAKLTRDDFIALIDRRTDIGVPVLWSFATTLSARLRDSNDRVAFFAMSNMFE
jgi:CRP-like cAMP-binding protein